MKRIRFLSVALLLGAGMMPAAQADKVLTVESVSGAAGVDRLGTHSELGVGDQLGERDVVHVGDGSRLSLDFGGHGFVELGPGAEVGIEKLPFASYADDLQTIFSLTRGYLRVVWKLAPPADRWPVFVYFGSQHAGLTPGEYFFDNRSGVARACVAAGRLSVMANAGTEMQKLHPSACYRFVAGLQPEKAPRETSTWISVRHSFDIDAPTSPEAMLAAGDVGNAGSVPPPPSAATAPKAPPPRPQEVKPAGTATAASKPPAAAADLSSLAAEPSPQPTGSGEWGVNVASYPAAEDADKHAQQLRAAGYAATAQPAQVKGQTWYRVQLRGYTSADAARAVAGELQARFAYQGLWVTKTGPVGAPAP